VTFRQAVDSSEELLYVFDFKYVLRFWSLCLG
jgi:hypothetical protein